MVSRTPPPRLLPTLFILILLNIVNWIVGVSSNQHETTPPVTATTCSATDHDDDDDDPSLQEMEFDIGFGTETFMAYVQPDVDTFYRDEQRETLVKDGDDDTVEDEASGVLPKHRVIGAKFINMGNQNLTLYWYGGGVQPNSFMAKAGPYQIVSVSSYPGAIFFFTPEDDPNTALIGFQVTKGSNNYFYDPFQVEQDDDVDATNNEKLRLLNAKELELYERHKKNRLFNTVYYDFTGREYLSMYPRNRPLHKMWRADYFGQEQWVTTKETHFVRNPPEKDLGEIKVHGKGRIIPDSAPRSLQEYRTPEPTLNMTLTTLSCAPRVFEIKNFLSDIEMNHVITLATGKGLDASKTEHPDPDRLDTLSQTRTSYNTWVHRESSLIVDAIYRRASDLLRINEALLRHRPDGEHPNMANIFSLAEAMQLVHYKPGQEYNAHHDFGYDMALHPLQPERFATLLLYLNEGMEGGETSFPLFVNRDGSEELLVVPEKGKAVLFYSALPDGNMDDLSRHAALPVKSGEKWLMNLWVHDPVNAYDL